MPSIESWESNKIPIVARLELQDHLAWIEFFEKEKLVLCHRSRHLRITKKQMEGRFLGFWGWVSLDLTKIESNVGC
ncbi:hypothetical protein EUGRSUZ_J01385 [Eucalyptus grandis]|uniref:Uncharacterized protein n=2 Tax=Eucalyptus grandis TaxID=71139 RepID=A0ACC3J551_EUCGR|nr:hypothetical protein EUGRSUZ_J01385 [Eucalyptus grandis]